jgi:hypothetical protein
VIPRRDTTVTASGITVTAVDGYHGYHGDCIEYKGDCVGYTGDCVGYKGDGSDGSHHDIRWTGITGITVTASGITVTASGITVTAVTVIPELCTQGEQGSRGAVSHQERMVQSP